MGARPGMTCIVICQNRFEFYLSYAAPLSIRCSCSCLAIAVPFKYFSTSPTHYVAMNETGTIFASESADRQSI